MSTPMYEPLQAVPPLTENHVKMAWLLQARQAARSALDAALAVPRRAAGYVGRLIHKLHLDSAASWLRRTAVRLAQPLKAASSVLGKTGLVAAATGVVTSPTGRAVLNTVGRTLGKLIGWTARKTYSGIDRVLRCFGKLGNKAADKMFAGVVSLGGKVATVATPVVHRVARLSDPSTTQARVLSGICQSYVIHKLLKGFIGNGWLRLAVELVLVPAVLDSRIWAWTKGTLQQARTRAHRLQEQAQVLVDLQHQEAAHNEQLLVPTDLKDMPVAAGLENVQLPDPASEVPVPSNRAERRAAQRPGKRPQH